MNLKILPSANEDFIDYALTSYMITIFQARHSGMDCRNLGSTDGSKFAILGHWIPASRRV
jgi:hypothetical protein